MAATFQQEGEMNKIITIKLPSGSRSLRWTGWSVATLSDRRWKYFRSGSYLVLHTPEVPSLNAFVGSETAVSSVVVLSLCFSFLRSNSNDCKPVNLSSVGRWQWPKGLGHHHTATARRTAVYESWNVRRIFYKVSNGCGLWKTNNILCWKPA